MKVSKLYQSSKKYLKEATKRLAWRIGYDIVRRNAPAPHGGLLSLRRKSVDEEASSVTADSTADFDAFAQQRRLLRGISSPVIFDVGAHTGETSRTYAGLFPTATIHAFEPFPPSFATLLRNTADLPQVVAHSLGLAETAQFLELHANAFAPTNSLLETHELADKVWGAGLLDTRDRISCPFSTLDLFVAEQGIERINLLKLDVQGAEYRVLEGAVDALRKRLIDVIYMEIILLPTYKGQWRLSQYLDFLEAYGMTLYGLYNLSCISGRLRQVDAIFVGSRTTPIEFNEPPR